MAGFDGGSGLAAISLVVHAFLAVFAAFARFTALLLLVLLLRLHLRLWLRLRLWLGQLRRWRHLRRTGRGQLHLRGFAAAAFFPVATSEARLMARLLYALRLWLWRCCLQLRLRLRLGPHNAAAPAIALVIVGTGPVLAWLLRWGCQLRRLLWLGLQQRLAVLLLAVGSAQVRATLTLPFGAAILAAVAVVAVVAIPVEAVVTVLLPLLALRLRLTLQA